MYPWNESLLRFIGVNSKELLRNIHSPGIDALKPFLYPFFSDFTTEKVNTFHSSLNLDKSWRRRLTDGGRFILLLRLFRDEKRLHFAHFSNLIKSHFGSRRNLSLRVLSFFSSIGLMLIKSSHWKRHCLLLKCAFVVCEMKTWSGERQKSCWWEWI